MTGHERRTTAEPSFDLHGIEGGHGAKIASVIPHRAAANLSLRLVRGQSPAEVEAAFAKRMRDAAPAGSLSRPAYSPPRRRSRKRPGSR